MNQQLNGTGWGTLSKHRKRISYIMMAVILIGAILFVVYVFQKINFAKEIQEHGVEVSVRCTEVWHTTTRIKSSRKKNSFISNKRKATVIKHYYANGEYTYNGQSYTCHKMKVNEGVKTGTVLTAKILPEHPEQWLYGDGDNERFTSMWWTAIIMVIVGTMGVSLSSITVRPRHRRNARMPASNGRPFSPPPPPQNSYDPNQFYNGGDWHG